MYTSFEIIKQLAWTLTQTVCTLYEYWAEQEKLQSSKERLLQNVPDVLAADFSELDFMPEGIIDDKEEDDSSFISGITSIYKRKNVLCLLYVYSFLTFTH